MRVAALYDIHGNLPALEAVLNDVDRAGVDAVVVGGDVLPGPMPSESLAALAGLAMPVHYLFGNGEADTLTAIGGRTPVRVPEAYRPVITWCGARLSSEQIATLQAWPATVVLAGAGGSEVLFCHATPRSDTEIFTRVTPEARIAPAFEGVSAALVICGHTHMPFDRVIAGRRVVNAGSVGMPFGEPGAYWLLLDDDGPHQMRTAFDLEAAAARIRATAYPGADAFAASYVLAPPGEAQMMAVFEPRE